MNTNNIGIPTDESHPTLWDWLGYSAGPNPCMDALSTCCACTTYSLPHLIFLACLVHCKQYQHVPPYLS